MGGSCDFVTDWTLAAETLLNPLTMASFPDRPIKKLLLFDVDNTLSLPRQVNVAVDTTLIMTQAFRSQWLRRWWILCERFVKS